MDVNDPPPDPPMAADDAQPKAHAPIRLDYATPQSLIRLNYATPPRPLPPPFRQPSARISSAHVALGFFSFLLCIFINVLITAVIQGVAGGVSGPIAMVIMLGITMVVMLVASLGTWGARMSGFPIGVGIAIALMMFLMGSCILGG